MARAQEELSVSAGPASLACKLPSKESGGIHAALVSTGVSSWLLVNAVYASAGWLAASAPEGYTLFSDLDTAVEVANLVPIILVLVAKDWVSKHCVVLSGCCVFLGWLGALFVIFGYSLATETASAGLLFSGAVAGLSGSTSMIVFFGFSHAVAGRSGTVAMSVGVGFNGLLTQFPALAVQHSSGQVGGFNTSAFFWYTFALQTVGLIAFGLLNVYLRNRSNTSVTLLSRASMDAGNIERVEESLASVAPEEMPKREASQGEGSLQVAPAVGPGWPLDYQDRELSAQAPTQGLRIRMQTWIRAHQELHCLPFATYRLRRLPT